MVRAGLVAGLGVLVAAGVSSAAPIDITVTVTNVQQADGLRMSPMFFATHSGMFDFFDVGTPASMAVERIAEDGNPMPLIAMAMADPAVSHAQAVAGGPIAPGESRSVSFTVDPDDPMTQALSFASMVVPSNDAFIGNDAPLALQLFDGFGDLIVRDGLSSYVVYGSDVWDAGTEINTEIPDQTAALGQMVPNTGLTEGGVVDFHQGLQGSLGAGGPLGNALDASPGADFTVPGTHVATITVVPEPATLVLLGVGGLVALRGRRRLTR